MLRRIRMHIGLSLMALLIQLITKGVLRGAQPRAHAHVAVLGDRLVDFLGSGRTALLALVLDGLDGVFDGIHCGDLMWCDDVLGG